jgi:hypothetical protein
VQGISSASIARGLNITNLETFLTQERESDWFSELLNSPSSQRLKDPQIDRFLSGDYPLWPFRKALRKDIFEPYVFAMAKASMNMARIQELKLEAATIIRSTAIVWFRSDGYDPRLG